ncbi:MAG: hypothetical protein HF982_10540 [Desulfobacteraceae bacterium]|nr:hypothetical protein [Desulfobacteraceae bacterium]MBC2720004.1 hypothetical protein [Desulfobacteraceae bacterium]
MKICKIAIVLLLVCAIYSPELAAKEPSNKWDNLLDIAYKFTWYPKKDLRDLLAKKAVEYEQGLEEYQNLVMKELTKGGNGGRVNPDLFIRNKPWKKYYRLAIAQFCLFLENDNQLYLENAKSVLSVLSNKQELSNVAFWHYLFQAYSDLVKKDRDAFVKNVFHLWQDVILKLEVDDILTGSEVFDTEFVYENIAHLIITRAIVQNTIPDLYPLSVIILSVKDKLTSENGYKNIVKAIAERMHGLKSDNFNLNFAVSFVEATANQYDFEDEKSSDLVVAKYNLARIYYELALSWANTRKGKAAILTQYMGFNNYVIRRLIDGDNLLASNPFFTTLPAKGNKLVEDSMALYGQLYKPRIIKSEFAAEGFNKKSDYIEAMHQLWDSSAQLLMMLFSYYKTDQKLYKNVAENVLLRYLSLFYKYAKKNSEIIPDNAFFLAAYAKNELSELYRQAMNYSTKIKVNDLALAFQLKAVEIFPIDIIGILKLAHQTNQEGRHNRYRKYVSPLASRLRASKVTSIWLNNHSTDYNNNLAMISNIIPDIIDNACFLVNFLRNSVGSDSEESVYNKTVVMIKLLMALKNSCSEKIIHDTLSSIAIQDFTDKNKTLNDIIQIALPADLHVLAKSIPGIETRYRSTRLKNELYASPNNPIHSYLRELYYEKSQ